MKIKILILFILLAFTIPDVGNKIIAQGQGKDITGIVTSFRKIPLNMVRVAATKSGSVALTDSSGRFSLKCFEKDILLIAASGFSEKKLKTGRETFYKIDLVYTDNPRNFNDAVSHGHISEKDLKKAISERGSINSRDYSKYKSIYELIASEMYNLRVNGTTILNTRVRSFDSTPEVLLVVDEKIVKDISFVNPSYVKSIEFIDDVGATMYGSMGANGVLKITLK